MHGMHIINPHRRHTKRALTLKCIARIWTSGGLSVDCRVAANPSVALKLIKYQTMMVMYFKHHPADACIQYDKLFCQTAAQDRTLHWDSAKNDIYVWAEIQSPPNQLGASQCTQSFRDKVSVLARLGPPTTPMSSTPL